MTTTTTSSSKATSNAGSSFPLLGMIVDRSSFDEDEDNRSMMNGSTDEAQFVSTDTTEKNGLHLSSDVPRVRNGKVRRKLRWKPAAFRKNKRRDDNASVVTKGSTKTSNSYHTFTSTETPVVSNQTNAQRLPIGNRPNYPDTFEGVSAIDTEGRYIHARMRQGIRSQSSCSSLSVSGRMNRSGQSGLSFDFQSIDEDLDYFDLDEDEEETDLTKSPVDPFRLPSPEPTMIKDRKRGYGRLPPSGRSGDLNNSSISSIAPQTPMGRKKNAMTVTPEPTPRTEVNTSLDDSMMTASSNAPSLGEIEVERRTSFFGTKQQPDHNFPRVRATPPRAVVSPASGPDAAAGLGFPRSSSPFPYGSGGFGGGKPPLTPVAVTKKSKSDPKLFESSLSPINVSPEPVPAKVSIDLDSPSNLSSMISQSGLLLGQNYAVGYVPRSSSSSPRRKYHRPVDSMSNNSATSRNSSSSFEDGWSSTRRRLLQDDDDFEEDKENETQSSRTPSTRSQRAQSPTMVGYHDGDSQDGSSKSVSTPPKGSSVATKSLGSRRNRQWTGPVDLDDGAFVDAERHLKAIHEMAAEHLAHGEYEEALDVFEEIMRGQKERYGEGHYRVGTALHNIGIVHLKSGNYEDAVHVCQQAVKIRKDALLPNHPDVAVSLAQLGVAHLECKNYRDALIAFREALQIRRDLLGPKHPKVGKIMNNIGCALYELEELDGARLAFDEALDIQRETLRSSPSIAEDDEAKGNAVLLSVAATLCNLGSIRLRWGQFDEAGIALEEALLLQQSVLGDEHPTVLSTIQSIEFVDKSKEDGATEPPTAKDFAEFARLKAAEAARMEAAGNGTCSNIPAAQRIAELFRWRSKRSGEWYQKLDDILKQAEPLTTCGTDSMSEDGVDDVASVIRKTLSGDGRRNSPNTAAEI